MVYVWFWLITTPCLKLRKPDIHSRIRLAFERDFFLQNGMVSMLSNQIRSRWSLNLYIFPFVLVVSPRIQSYPTHVISPLKSSNNWFFCEKKHRTHMVLGEDTHLSRAPITWRWVVITNGLGQEPFYENLKYQWPIKRCIDWEICLGS